MSTAASRSARNGSPWAAKPSASARAAACSSASGSPSAWPGVGRGCSTGWAISVPRSRASASGPSFHRPSRASALPVSAACTRHRSAANSACSLRALASSSGGAKVWPLSRACSRRTRAQKPWMVKIAARSISSTACCRRRCTAGALSSVRARCAVMIARLRASSGGSSAVACVPITRAARARRSRMRLRSSWVAASVKVTARIWPMRRFFSTTRRVTRVARVKVLPVPAEASIRAVPVSGRVR